MEIVITVYLKFRTFNLTILREKMIIFNSLNSPFFHEYAEGQYDQKMNFLK